VTLNELLALLGRAWPRLLLYPGGLAAFAAIWLLAFLQARGPRPPAQDPRLKARAWFLALGSLAPPWLALALLPLPPAPILSRQIDLLVALGLLECPLLLAIARDLRVPHQATRAAAVRRLAAALNGYPPLILAALALAQASGSFELAALARVPGEPAPAFAAPLHWLGAAAWVLALPPALGLGPFASRARELRGQGRRPLRPPKMPSIIFDSIETGLRLRAIGLVLIAALPAMAAFGALDEGGLRTIRGLAAWALSPPAVAALLWAYDRLLAGQPARWWARAYLALDVALLLALLWAAYQALQVRLS
jgi:hypothetical protein